MRKIKFNEKEAKRICWWFYCIVDRGYNEYIDTEIWDKISDYLVKINKKRRKQNHGN